MRLSFLRFVAVFLGGILMTFTAPANALLLDLTSGTKTVGPGGIGFNIYQENGFRLQTIAGGHFDSNLFGLGDIALHKGPQNSANPNFTLTFGGIDFSLESIDVGGFVNGTTSFTATGSNGNVQSISSIGLVLLSGFSNVTSVLFGSFNGGSQGAIGINGINVNGAVGVVPIPAALPLYGTGLALMGFIGWRRKRKAVAAA